MSDEAKKAEEAAFAKKYPALTAWGRINATAIYEFVEGFSQLGGVLAGYPGEGDILYTRHMCENLGGSLDELIARVFDIDWADVQRERDELIQEYMPDSQKIAPNNSGV